MWLTTKDGRHFNTDWIDNEEKKAVDADADKKEKQMAQAREEAKKASEAEKKSNQVKVEKAPGLIFGIASITDTYVDIDGYSNKPTVKGMLGELAKAVEKYDKGEADGIRSMVKDKAVEQFHPRKEEPAAQYICEWEEVPSASRHIDKDGKDTLLSGKDWDDIEYKDAKFYVHCRIIR